MLRTYAFSGVLAAVAGMAGAGCTVEPNWEVGAGHPADPQAPVAAVEERSSPLDAESHLAFRLDEHADHEPNDHEHHGHDHGHDGHEHEHDGQGHDHDREHNGHDHGHGHAHDDMDLIEHGPDADYSRYCVVSGEPLGEFGDPYVVEHAGRFALTCCRGCSRDFEDDPEKYLNRLDGIFDDDHNHDGHDHDHDGHGHDDDDDNDDDNGHAH